MVKLFTSRLTYNGKDKINATVKSGEGLGDVLAPTWALVAGHKLYQAEQRQDAAEVERWQHSKVTGNPTEPLSEAEYTERYLKILRTRYAENKQPFLDILAQPQATITCYCAPGTFCHRHIAADVLGKIAEKHGLPFQQGGEVDPHTGRVWLAPNDPNRRDVQFGVLPVFSPDKDIQLGYAAVGRVSNPKNINVAIELAHFRSHASAEQYLGNLESTLSQKHLPLSGTKDELDGTERFLILRAREVGLPATLNFLTHARNKAWNDGTLRLTHTEEELRFPPERQELRFGILPIKAPDGMTPLGFAATTLLQQGDTHALLELAHFANNGAARAEHYLDGIEDTLEQGGFSMTGQSITMRRTVDWLAAQARENDLDGDWQPLTHQQAQDLDAGTFALTHSFREVRTMSSGWMGIQFEEDAYER
jgi:hypothetical protein